MHENVSTTISIPDGEDRNKLSVSAVYFALQGEKDLEWTFSRIARVMSKGSCVNNNYVAAIGISPTFMQPVY